MVKLLFSNDTRLYETYYAIEAAYMLFGNARESYANYRRLKLLSEGKFFACGHNHIWLDKSPWRIGCFSSIGDYSISIFQFQDLDE